MTDRSSYQRNYQKDYQARTKRVNLLLSASEFRELERGAGRKGEAVSTYAKRCALEAVRRRMIWNRRPNSGADRSGSSGLGYAA
jgi:hypothetical protein